MREVIEALRVAGVEVVEPCRSCPRGLRAATTGLTVAMSDTDGDAAAADVDAARAAAAVAYVERSGRVWLLADGASGDGVVFVAGVDETTDEQDSAVRVLADALAEWFDIDDSADASGSEPGTKDDDDE